MREVLNLAGFLDVVDFTGFLAAPYFGDAALAGLPSIIDYKSRGSFSYAPSSEQLKFDKQLAKYFAMGVIGSPRSPWCGLDPGTPSRDGRPFPTEAVVCHVNIGTKTIEVDRRWTVMPWANVEVAWADAEVEAFDLLDLCHIDRIDDVEADRTACNKYGGCDFKSICPHSPENRVTGGRFGALFGTRNTTAPAAHKEKKMGIRERLAARKSPVAASAPTEETPSPTKAPEAPAEKGGVAERLRARKGRPQAHDVGVQRVEADVAGSPVVVPPLVKDVVAIARTAVRDNDLTMDAELLKFACGEVGLDLSPATAKALRAALGEDGKGVVWSDLGGPVEEHPVEETAAVEVAKALDLPAPVEEAGEGPTTSGVTPLSAALLALETVVEEAGGRAERGGACVLAREAWNAVMDASGEGEKIGRFTAARLERMIDGTNLVFDAEANVIMEATTVDAAEDATADAEEATADAEDEALEAELEELRAKRDAEEDARVVALCAKMTKAPPAPEFSACLDPADRMVLVNCVPSTGGGVPFTDWLAPYIAELEESIGGVYWNSMDYAKGPGSLANIVARDLMATGVAALPMILVVDKFHPAWQAVRDFLGRLDGIFFIEATR